MLDPGLELADLHIHVGAAVAPHILWSIAHDQGFKLPVHTYWEFRDLVTAKAENVSSLNDYLAILHHWTEKIQSSPAAIERSVYEVIGKECRSSGVSLIELRFNPMKRNLGGERDLDHIIHAALRGLDRAVLEYDIKAGLIFCLAREFPAGLSTTIHTGETPATNGEGVIAVVKHLKPKRIGHGIRAAYNDEAMRVLAG